MNDDHCCPGESCLGTDYQRGEEGAMICFRCQAEGKVSDRYYCGPCMDVVESRALAAEARAEKAEREIATLRADLDVAESRKSGVIRGLVGDLDAAREALRLCGAFSVAASLPGPCDCGYLAWRRDSLPAPVEDDGLDSPPAPVEDDGLDAALDGWWDGHDLPTTGDLHRWLRELQARRRGER